MGVEIFQKLLFCIYFDYHMNLSCNLLIWYITLMDLCILKNACIPGKNPTWWLLSWCSAPAAAAKSLQLCPAVCDPIDGSPPGSLIPGILQGRALEWIAMSFSNAGKWKWLSRVQLLATPWTEAHQAPPLMEFSRQEYWSGVPLPSPYHGVLSFQCIFEFCLLVFCWVFLHLFSSVILAYNFLFCVIFVCFWYKGDDGLIEWVWWC